MSDDLDDLFNTAALKKVPDPAGTPTVLTRKTLAERRLAYQKLFENPDLVGMLYSMLAASGSIHPEIQVGAVAYSFTNQQFGGPACNHLNQVGRSVERFSPYMLANPLDKHYTECAEIRAIDAAKFLVFDSNQLVRRDFEPVSMADAERHFQKPYHKITQEQLLFLERQRVKRHNPLAKTWVMYTTRLPCKRCRGFIAEAAPLEVAVHLQTTEALTKQKKGYAADVQETTAFFQEHGVKIRYVDIPRRFAARVLSEVVTHGFTFGVPTRRPWRTPRRRQNPEARFNREDDEGGGS